MQGKSVIVRVVGDQFEVRRVWSIGQNVIYVTDEKNYELLLNNGDGVTPIGVPKEDVFEYDEAIKKGKFDNLKRWKNT